MAMMQPTLTRTQKSKWPIRNYADVEAINQAAHAGQADAMRQVAVLMASGIGCEPNWPAALAWAQAAAERGDDNAQSELIVLSGDEAFRAYLTSLARQGRPFPAETWSRLAGSVDWRTLITPVIGNIVCEDPLIAHVPGFISPGLCAYLCARARPDLQRATVVRNGQSTFELDDSRTNTMFGYSISTVDLPLVALQQKIATLVEMPVTHLEPINVLHYSAGERFTHHFDSFSSREDMVTSPLGNYGQRLLTLLVYLNEDYEEGETDFPALNFKFRGKTGDALFWRNTTEDGEVHQLTLHAGLPPRSGEKWVISQWIREFPLPEFAGES